MSVAMKIQGCLYKDFCINMNLESLCGYENRMFLLWICLMEFFVSVISVGRLPLESPGGYIFKMPRIL